MNRHTKRWSSLMAASLLAMGATVATAQPGGHAGHGPGPGFGIEQVLAHLQEKLDLNTSQQLMWDNAVAQGKAARDAGRAARQSAHDALKAELAKPEPDFAAVAAAADAAQANGQALRKQVRDEWLKLYATFTPAQKLVVRDAVQSRVARMETFREKMKARMQRGS